MKWEYYNLMTDKDQEEYDYKFGYPGGETKISNIMDIFFLPAFFGKLIFFGMSFVMLFGLFFKEQFLETGSWLDFQIGFLTSFEPMINSLLVITIFCGCLIILSLVGTIISNKTNKWLKLKGYDIKFAEYDIKQLKEKK